MEHDHSHDEEDKDHEHDLEAKELWTLDEKNGFVCGDGTDAFPTGIFTTADGGVRWDPVKGPRLPSSRGAAVVPATKTALVAGATVLRITGEPLPALEIALARTFGVAAVAAIVLALVRLALGRVGERPEPLHPFL